MNNREQMEDLVRRMQAGDEDAAADLYETHYEDVYYFILKTVGEPELAEDLTQDTFIEILQTISNLKEPAAFPAWSRKIAYHRCAAYFRKTREVLVEENADGQTVFDTVAEEREEFIPDEALDKEDLKQTILAMIQSLPEEQRTAILMRYFDELSVKEIAQVQGVTEGTVKSRLNYGRNAIKRSVETYEKKNGIKLRCAGVVPLLLWLFRSKKATDRVFTVAEAATTAEAVADAAAPLVTEGVKKGVGFAGKFAAKKLVAWLTAAAVASGGVAVAARLQDEPEEPKKEKPMTWWGYGQDINHGKRRFDLEVEEMTEDSIRGHLQVSCLYESVHDSEFEGVGTAAGEDTVYTVTFENPAVVGSFLTYRYDTTELTYHKEQDIFSFDRIYKVSMERTDTKTPKLLERNAKWSGLGEDGFYNYPNNYEHQFVITVSRMTARDLRGEFTVRYGEAVDHISEFAGRGYSYGGKYVYEIKLETPRQMRVIGGVLSVSSFWLEYDPMADTLTIPGHDIYQFTLYREK